MALALALSAAVLLLAAPAQAQVSADPPGPVATLKAFRAVEEWVHRWETPPESAAPDEALPVSAGVCITLRYSGQVVGRGVSVAERVNGPDWGDRRLLVRAARLALKEADRRLPVPNDALRREAIRVLASSGQVMISLELAGPFTPFEPDTWADAELKLSPGLDGVRACFAASNRTGGVDASGPSDDTAAIVFPSTMLATSTLPDRALSGAIARAIGEGGAAEALDQPKDIRAKHGLRLERFRVAHIAQSGPGQESEFLYRGAKPLAANGALTVTDVRAMAGQLAAFLCRLINAQPHAVAKWNTVPRPGYETVLVVGPLPAAPYEPQSIVRAEDSELRTVLVAGAIAQWSLQASDVDDRASADEFASRLLRGTAERLYFGPDTGPDPAVLALWSWAYRSLSAKPYEELFGFVGHLDELTEAAKQLGSFGDPIGLPIEPRTSEWLAGLPALEAGIVALSDARYASHSWLATYPGGNAQQMECEYADAFSTDRWLFSSPATSGGLAAMPWLGWAELELDNAKARVRVEWKMAGVDLLGGTIKRGRDGADLSGAPPDPRGPFGHSPFPKGDPRDDFNARVKALAPGIPSAVALREMRSEFWRHQLTAADVGPDRQDMIGGVVLADAEGHSSAFPTWECARPLAFIATMLREPSLTELAERPREIARLLAAIGYLHRLQADDSIGWMHPDPARAVGGIRAAVWDNSMPIGASAYTLLCLVETIKSLDELAQKPGEPVKPGDLVPQK